MSKDYVSVNSLSNEQRETVKKSVDAIVDALTRIAAERDYIKESLSELQEKTGVDKKIIRKMAKVAFNASFQEESELNSEFESMYTVIMGEEVG